MILKKIRESWNSKIKSLNTRGIDLDEYNKDFKNYYFNIDVDLRDTLDKCYHFHTFINFMGDYSLTEYLPFWKHDSLEMAGIEKAFFKQYWNWKKLTEEEKEVLDQLILWVYDMTVTEIYEEYLKTRW